MKLIKGLLFLLVFLPAITVYGQASGPHVIVIVQENRTPDSLFQDSVLKANGADINTTGHCFNGTTDTTYTLQPYAFLDACFNPNHNRGPATGTNKGGFEGAYTSYTAAHGIWDGACTVPPDTSNCTTVPTGYLNYTYVNDSPSSPTIILPYLQIAQQYGFSNYAFQSNQGPSFPAHQFLFSGTSAPWGNDGSSGDFWTYFAAENPLGNSTHSSGCASVSTTYVYELFSTYSGSGWAPEGKDYTPPYTGANLGYPCYDHPSMGTLLNAGGVGWKYYIQNYTYDNSIWTAPNSLNAICPFNPTGGVCSSTDWTNHVSDTTGQIFSDITGCTLPSVSWVIPDGAWSDHPGDPGSDGGPSWVAAIVNAIGNDTTCGYWGGSNNTTILITWDDWGGWYDHVPPYLPATGSPNGGYQPSNSNGDWYVYGFRVPLLVVSAYTNFTTTGVDGFTGYISGTGGESQPYIHDFGSILAYIENTFGLSSYSACGIAGSDLTHFPDGCAYPYADYFAPDGPVSCYDVTKCGSNPLPLSDFFFTGTPRTFTTITGAKYAASCFANYTNAQGCFPYNFPSDPDDE